MSTHALATRAAAVPLARPASAARRVAVAAFPGPAPSGGPIKGLGAAHQRKLGDSDLVVSCK